MRTGMITIQEGLKRYLDKLEKQQNDEEKKRQALERLNQGEKK